MTPPAAAPTVPTHPRTRRPARPPAPPRRVSGPAGGARVARGGVVVLPLPARVADTARRIPDAPLLDRLVRGRLWIAVITVALMGIVFTQVSLLALNASISRAVLQAESLERANSGLRDEIARLGSAERVQATATALGMTAPPAGDVRFLRAGEADPGRVARTLAPPDATAWQAALAAEATQTEPPGTDVSEQAPAAPGTAAAAAAPAQTPAAPAQTPAAQPVAGQPAAAPLAAGTAPAATPGPAAPGAVPTATATSRP